MNEFQFVLEYGKQTVGTLLTPLEEIRKTKSEGAVLKCQCVCGEYRNVPLKYLRTRSVTRCKECAMKNRRSFGGVGTYNYRR